MNKTISCVLSVAFASATVGVMLNKNELKKDLVEQLTDKELVIYNEIKIERRTIYLKGLVAGVILSLIYLNSLSNPSNDRITNLCVVFALTMVVNYFFYILHPKSKYMLEYLDSAKENKAWLKIYKGMQFKYHLSFLLGLLGATSFYNYLI
jgi:uncharacterized protein YacL